MSINELAQEAEPTEEILKTIEEEKIDLPLKPHSRELTNNKLIGHSMNILLIYPQYPDTFWSFKHSLRFISKKAAFPPLGLLTVAAMLPDGWRKKLVDLNVEPLSDEQLAWADMVFLSAMIVQKESARQIIQRCRAHGKKVVAGGPVFTTQHERFEGVDHFILNEAEITLPLFLKDLAAGQPKPLYTSEERPDITQTPVPLWSLIDIKNYATMAIQYSRGCPFNCEFCDIIIMNGKIQRVKSPTQMQKEFQALFDAGWRLGIVSKARFRYWKLIVKTFFVKREALPIAVELAIHGFHFEKILKRVCRPLNYQTK